MKKIVIGFLLALGLLVGIAAYRWIQTGREEIMMLQDFVRRLEAHSRVAEVIVTELGRDDTTGRQTTRIKFLEYDHQGQPLTPRYFTFSDNIIQFQSLVVRFDDVHVRHGDLLRGKSVHLFWKIFMLDGERTEEYSLMDSEAIAESYGLTEMWTEAKREFWERFWRYILDADHATTEGVKNAQIEAPGTRFIPGMIYSIVLEHDGGLRIDTRPIPDILVGEHILHILDETHEK